MYGWKALDCCSIPFISKFFFHKYLTIKLFIYIVLFIFMNGKLIVIASMALHGYIRIKSNDYIFHKFDQHPNVVPLDVFPDSQDRSQPHISIGETIK